MLDSMQLRIKEHMGTVILVKMANVPCIVFGR